jgi:homoserine O-acetyltransferase
LETSPETRFLDMPGVLNLERGGRLEGVRVAYRTWGSLDASCSNAVWVCHALTGSADADEWWGPLFGTGRTLDPARDFIVCANILGSCYGTTGPGSVDPGTGLRYGPDFPAITVRDMVQVQRELADALGIRKIRLVLGGSLGGMQALEWAIMDPDRVGAIAPIAVSGRHSAWCIGLSEAQRQAIAADPRWRGGRYEPDDPPAAGLAAARMVAMCTYRSQPSLERRFGRRLQGDGNDLFAIENYLRYQGSKLVHRFDANSYMVLTRAMDTHDVARGRGEFGAVLGSIGVRALVVSVDSDVLYPPHEQMELADGLPNAEFWTLHSDDGHDAFLIEMEALDERLVTFRAREQWKEDLA